MSKFITQVYELPGDQQAAAHFFEELKVLADRHGVAITGGSKVDELSYIEILEEALQEEIGFTAAEEIRLDFERGKLATPQQG